ncbi:F-box protein At5g49610-like [Sesamum indicum]|uniref:F-box protein At5g49610-like n=1 Tax=Sesamum indicum TaxID=4182 RepID=A0A6I9T2W9_SESIN|nr:F-box protein At5g49610-like [Sesamum indicum]
MAFNGELFDIFSWLPAKSLYRLSSVCKSSKELLSDDFFIRKQFKNMQLVSDRDFFIYPDIFQRYRIGNLEFHALSSKNSNSSLPLESLNFLANHGNIIASSNGLLCCRNIGDDENPLFLFNPTTWSYLPIPLPDERSTFRLLNIVFVCEKDEDSKDDFLLLTLFSPDEWGEKFHSKIYSPEERTWRDGGRVDVGQRDMNFEHMVKQNGVVYMVSNCFNYFAKGSRFFWPYIVAYDIKNSNSRFLKIPKGARKGVWDSMLRIFKWGNHPNNSEFNSICLVKLLKNTFTVWVLVRTRSSYYWKRVFRMRVKAMALALSKIDHLRVEGFAVFNGSFLIFATERKVYSFNLIDGEEAEEVCGHQFGNYVRFASFSSTLRPCGPGAITLPLHA